MKKSKKLLLGSLTSIVAVAAPISVVVSCGDNPDDSVSSVTVNVDNAIERTRKNTQKWNTDHALLTRNFVTFDASQYAKIKKKIWEYKSSSPKKVQYTGDVAAFKAYAGKVYVNKIDKTINLFATNDDVDKYLAEKSLTLSELKTEGTWVVGNTSAKPFFSYPHLGSTIADKSDIFGFNTTTKSFVAKATGVAASATLLDITKSAARSYLYTHKLAFNFETRDSKFMVEQIGSSGSSVTGFFDIVIKVKPGSDKTSAGGTDLSNKYIWFESDQLSSVLEYFGVSTIADLKTKVDFIVGKDSTPNPSIKTQFQSINEATTVDTEHLDFDTKTWNKTVGFDSLNSNFRDPAAWLVGDILKQLLDSWGQNAPHIKTISGKLAKYKEGQNNGFQILGGKLINTILNDAFLQIGRSKSGVLPLFNKFKTKVKTDVTKLEKGIEGLVTMAKQFGNPASMLDQIKAKRKELSDLKAALPSKIIMNLFAAIANDKPKDMIMKLLGGIISAAGPVFDDAGINVGDINGAIREISGHTTKIKLTIGGKPLEFTIPKFNLSSTLSDMIDGMDQKSSASGLLNLASTQLLPMIGKALTDATLADLLGGKSLLKSAETTAQADASTDKKADFDIEPFAQLLYKILGGLDRIDTKKFGTMKFSEEDKKLITSTFKFSAANTNLFTKIVEDIVSMYNKA